MYVWLNLAMIRLCGSAFGGHATTRANHDEAEHQRVAVSDQPGAGVDLHLQPGDVTSVIRRKE